MKSCFAFFLGGIFFALAPLGSLPAAPSLPETFDVAAIDQFLTAQSQRKDQVGFSIAIVKNGDLVLSKGYGRCARENSAPVETNTLFAIGSVTKQFTCACVLLLAEEGKLSPRDKVAKYFPDLTRARDITLLDLMNHTSGYPDYYPLDFVDRRMQQAIAPDELLRRYAGGKLDFEPGSRFSYSNTGYILLARIVEKVSGESFGSFVTRKIFQPLALNDSLFEPAASGKNFARGYLTFVLSEPMLAQPEQGGWLGGAGGIYSTPADLVKWDLALSDGKILSPLSTALMTAPRQLTTGKISDYGCGLRLETREGRKVFQHSGAVSGFNAWNGVVPSTKSALAMICNREGALGSLPSQIFSLLLKEESHVPKIAGDIASDTARKIFGDYQKGRLNRAEFSEEFNFYLTDARLAGAAKRLKNYGPVQKAETISSSERGGMEVTTTRLHFARGTLRALMYRQPDGRIEQFLIYPE